MIQRVACFSSTLILIPRFLAVLLGHFQLTVAKSIEIYLQLSQKLFEKSSTMGFRTINLMIGRPEFSSSKLKSSIDELLTSLGAVDQQFSATANDCKT
jgi:hypothetical protein